MKVHWTNTAEGHLDAIFDYIAQNSPEYAKRMVDRITRRSNRLPNIPSQDAELLNTISIRFAK